MEVQSVESVKLSVREKRILEFLGWLVYYDEGETIVGKESTHKKKLLSREGNQELFLWGKTLIGVEDG